MLLPYKLHCRDILVIYLFRIRLIYLFITKFRKHFKLVLSQAIYYVDCTPEAKKKKGGKKNRTNKTIKNQTKNLKNKSKR